jgi:hypothetical protein
MTLSCFLLCHLQAKATASAKVEEKKPEKVEVVKADAKVNINTVLHLYWNDYL